MTNHDLANIIRKRFRDGDSRLPVLPESVIKVRRIVQDESKGAADIARVIGADPTLSSTVLKIANSARFKSGNHEIRSLPMAIQRLGGRRTLDLLVAISSQLHLAVKNRALQTIIREAAHYSLRVATTAQHLARLTSTADPEEAFLAGMMFDIGVAAVISAAPEELEAYSEKARLSAIRDLHREMGGRLLNMWEMPDIFSSVASHHGIEADDRPHENLIDIIDASCFLLQALGYPPPFDDSPDGANPLHYPPIIRLNIADTHLAAVEVELEDGFKELNSAMGT